jgi:hypothetical protein
MRTIGRVGLVVGLLAVAASAGAQAPTVSQQVDVTAPPAGVPVPAAGAVTRYDVVQAPELAKANASSAYEAVQFTRPLFLAKPGTRVRVDGMYMDGGVEALRTLPAHVIESVRLVRSVGGLTNGDELWVTMKHGRS